MGLLKVRPRRGSNPGPQLSTAPVSKPLQLCAVLSTAETLNGRVAMVAFVVLFLQELVFGKGILELYGLPYDEGAILLK